MTTRRLVTNAILVALYFVLSLYSIRLGFLTITFAAFPILVAGLLYGWADGLAVGALGGLLSQLASYGLGPTTLMWMAPSMVRGLMVGLYAKRRGFQLSMRQTTAIVLASCLVVTALNTVVIYIDGLIYHYPTGLTAGVIALRFVSSVVMSVVYTLIAPKTVALLRRAKVDG